MATRIPYLIILVTLLSGLGFSEDKPAKRVGLIFEGIFEAADLAIKPDGAEKTQLVATYEWDYGVRFFTSEKWEKDGFDWDRFNAIARNTADEVAKAIEPTYVRDDREVIEYAIVVGKDPFLSSALLSPHFVSHFSETLGDEVQVLLVDRHRMYVFPVTGGKLDEYGPALVEEFRSTDLPISLEVFQVDSFGYRVIGELSRPE